MTNFDSIPPLHAFLQKEIMIQHIRKQGKDNREPDHIQKNGQKHDPKNRPL